jgi:hypothetical protein
MPLTRWIVDFKIRRASLFAGLNPISGDVKPTVTAVAEFAPEVLVV